MADLLEFYPPITEDEPCGVDLVYDNERLLLNTLILGTADPEGKKANEPPNWREVQKKASALLAKSKDIQLILYLIRALIRVEGLTGFRDGLLLLEHVVSNYWACFHPQLDPEDQDPFKRIKILEELNSYQLVLLPLIQTNLAESRIGRFSLRDIYYVTGKLELPVGTNKPDDNAIKAAFRETEAEKLLANYQAINDTIELLTKIQSVVNTELSATGDSINFEAVQNQFKELLYQFNLHTEDFLAIPNAEVSLTAEEETENEAGATTSDKQSVKVAMVKGQIQSREDVINTLNLLCDYYSKYEPTSPVPIFLERAKALVNARFIDIVKNIMPSALPQIDLLKGPESDNTQ